MHNCSGCLSCNNIKVSNCNFNIVNDDGRCPCTICIVKMMCNSLCDIFLAHIAQLNREHEQEAHSDVGWRVKTL